MFLGPQVDHFSHLCKFVLLLTWFALNRHVVGIDIDSQSLGIASLNADDLEVLISVGFDALRLCYLYMFIISWNRILKIQMFWFLMVIYLLSFLFRSVSFLAPPLYTPPFYFVSASRWNYGCLRKMCFQFVGIQLMHCCFANPLNLQLDINFIQSDIKNLGWRGNILLAQPLPLCLSC